MGEIEFRYPQRWEEEYKRSFPDFPRDWRRDYPELFDGTLDGSRVPLKNTGVPGTLSEFCDYALMYLLRRDGYCSITYYELRSSDYTSAVGRRRKSRHDTMRKWMGDSTFEALQTAIRSDIADRFGGEPDLFCWHANTGDWFFAEAKCKDKLTKLQPKWFEICRETIPGVEIRIYRLSPEP